MRWPLMTVRRHDQLMAEAKVQHDLQLQAAVRRERALLRAENVILQKSLTYLRQRLADAALRITAKQ